MFILIDFKNNSMKTIIKWSASLLSIFAVFAVEAQTTDELLQLGTHEVQGTARFTGMGGAFNALGGDFSSLSTNPAGIGTYRSSEFVITPSLTINKATTDFLGRSLSDSRTRFGLANLGYIGTSMTKKSEGLISLSFGLGYNKVANFNKRTKLEGYDSPLSVLDFFPKYANSLNINPNYLGNEFKDILPEDWSTAIAYFTEMMLYEDGQYKSFGLYDGNVVDIYRTSLQSGGTEEYTFSFGGNISNKFQFGVTVGFQDLEYINRLNYREEFLGTGDNVAQYFSSERDEYTRTSGFGVNAKFGAIYRPANAFRLGLAIHTPTFFNMEREYQVYMGSIYKINGENDLKSENPDPDIYEYRLQTPYRLEAGIAYIIGKIGLISLDYELVGNNSVRIRDNIWDDTDFLSSRNNLIKKSYKATSNIRIGAEVNLPYGIMLRGGFNYFQSPYKDSNLDFDRYAYSGGIGFRGKHFFADLAYTLNTGKYHYGPYYVNDNRKRTGDAERDIAVETLNVGRIITTIGFKF
jgi:hypothetical protein